VRITEDVAEFMAEKIRSLRPETQELLKLSAALGAALDHGTLSQIAEQSISACAEGLWDALAEGLLVPLHDDYRLLRDLEGLPAATADREYASNVAAGITYRFLHEWLVCLPLIHQGRLSGVWYSESGAEGEVRRGGIELMQMLASQAATALENARLVEPLQATTRQLSATFVRQSLAQESHQPRERAMAHDLADRLDQADVLGTSARDPAAQHGHRIATLPRAAVRVEHAVLGAEAAHDHHVHPAHPELGVEVGLPERVADRCPRCTSSMRVMATSFILPFQVGHSSTSIATVRHRRSAQLGECAIATPLCVSERANGLDVHCAVRVAAGAYGA
jgi:hypothetical protein